MNWYSQACEAFWAACKASASLSLRDHSTSHCRCSFAIGRCWEPHAVSLKGRSKDCQCPWGSLRKPATSPVPNRQALCSNHSQEHPSTMPLPASVSAVQTQWGYHTACPAHILAVHLLVALPTYLLGKHRENCFSHFCICYFPSLLPGKDVHQLYGLLGKPHSVYTLMAVPRQPLGQPAQHNMARAPDLFPDNSQQKTKISSGPCLRQQSSQPGAKLRHQEPVIETCLVKRGIH